MPKPRAKTTKFRLVRINIEICDEIEVCDVIPSFVKSFEDKVNWVLTEWFDEEIDDDKEVIASVSYEELEKHPEKYPEMIPGKGKKLRPFRGMSNF